MSGDLGTLHNDWYKRQLSYPQHLLPLRYPQLGSRCLDLHRLPKCHGRVALLQLRRRRLREGREAACLLEGSRAWGAASRL